MTNLISIEGKRLSLARLAISPGSQLAGKTVSFEENNYHLNIILVRQDNQSDMHPTDLRCSVQVIHWQCWADQRL